MLAEVEEEGDELFVMTAPGNGLVRTDSLYLGVIFCGPRHFNIRLNDPPQAGIGNGKQPAHDLGRQCQGLY